MSYSQMKLKDHESGTSELKAAELRALKEEVIQLKNEISALNLQHIKDATSITYSPAAKIISISKFNFSFSYNKIEDRVDFIRIREQHSWMDWLFMTSNSAYESELKVREYIKLLSVIAKRHRLEKSIAFGTNLLQMSELLDQKDSLLLELNTEIHTNLQQHTFRLPEYGVNIHFSFLKYIDIKLNQNIINKPITYDLTSKSIIIYNCLDSEISLNNICNSDFINKLQSFLIGSIYSGESDITDTLYLLNKSIFLSFRVNMDEKDQQKNLLDELNSHFPANWEDVLANSITKKLNGKKRPAEFINFLQFGDQIIYYSKVNQELIVLDTTEELRNYVFD